MEEAGAQEGQESLEQVGDLAEKTALTEKVRMALMDELEPDVLDDVLDCGPEDLQGEIDILQEDIEAYAERLKLRQGQAADLKAKGYRAQFELGAAESLEKKIAKMQRGVEALAELKAYREREAAAAA